MCLLVNYSLNSILYRIIKEMPFNSTISSSEICPQEVKYSGTHTIDSKKYLPDSFCGNKYMKYTCKVCKVKWKTRFLCLISRTICPQYRNKCNSAALCKYCAFTSRDENNCATY